MAPSETYALHTDRHGHASSSNIHGNSNNNHSTASSLTRLWHSFRTTRTRHGANKRTDDPSTSTAINLTTNHTSTSAASASHSSHSTEPPTTKPKWYRIHLGRGMYNDLRRRLPFYASDYIDAWDYRVVPATIYMYFANILPALAFSLDMFEKTNNSFGVNEVLLSSVLGAVVFSLCAAQPLVIVGVTGPITVFSYTVYDIIVPTGTDFFSFMCLIGLWALGMHWILALTNSCNGLRYVTRFSCDTFGFYVAFIYLQKGIQVLTRQFAAGDASAYLSIMVALLVLVVAYACGIIGASTLFHRILRKFIEDYGTPLTIIFFTGFVHIGKMEGITITTLPTSKSFFPTKDRSWFVDPSKTSTADVFIAIPFAILLTILFWFDHNVSSLIAQGTEFPLRKPAGFHWDIFLLGLTTGVAGLLGIPFPNGLIPQAPFHTNALCVTRQVVHHNEKRDEEGDPGSSSPPNANVNFTPTRVVDHVVEQRVSNLAQGLLTLGTMSGPLLIVLHLIPQAVLAGLFFVMGVQALEGNGITLKLLYLLRDNSLYPSALTDDNAPLRALQRQHMIWLFVALELIAFGATFAITQTIAAIGFPVIILALIPFRAFLMPRWFKPEELRALDAPTASPFTMESVGGVHGAVGGIDDPLNLSSSSDDDVNPDAREVEEGTAQPKQNEEAIDSTSSIHSKQYENEEEEGISTKLRPSSPDTRRRRASSRRARPGAEVFAGPSDRPESKSRTTSFAPMHSRDEEKERGDDEDEMYRLRLSLSRSRSRGKVGRLGSNEF